MANPALMVLPLDGSLQGTDRSGVFSAVGAGAVRYRTLSGRQVGWLEQATTNLVSNPYAWSDTMHITTYGLGSITGASTDKPGFSPRCLKVVSTGDNHGANFQNPSVLSITGTPQTYVGRIAAVGDGLVRARINARYGDDSTDHGSWTSSVSLDGTTPTEFVCPSLAINTAKTLVRLDVECRTHGAQNVTFYLAFAQIELATYATSAVPVLDSGGSPVSGYAYTGTAHASTSTRTAATITMDEAGRIDPLAGSLAFRYVRDIDTGAAEPILDVGEGTSGKDRLRLRINSSDKLEVSWQSDGASETTLASTESIAVGQEYLIYVGWQGTAVEVSIDNGVKATGTRNAPQGNWGTTDLVLKAA